MKHFLIQSKYNIELSQREIVFLNENYEMFLLFLKSIDPDATILKNTITISILSKSAPAKLKEIKDFFTKKS